MDVELPRIPEAEELALRALRGEQGRALVQWQRARVTLMTLRAPLESLDEAMAEAPDGGKGMAQAVYDDAPADVRETIDDTAANSVSTVLLILLARLDEAAERMGLERVRLDPDTLAVVAASCMAANGRGLRWETGDLPAPSAARRRAA